MSNTTSEIPEADLGGGLAGGRPPKRKRAKRRVVGLALIVLILGLASPVLADGGSDSIPARSMRISRWVSNLSGGVVLGRRPGLVKSVWWYAVPNVFALGLSFDFVGPFIPLSIDVALQAPIAAVTPFLCGGVGGGVNGHGIASYGGGVRVRLVRKFGLVFEYRRYHYTQETAATAGGEENIAADYLGAGISWRY